MHSVVAAGPCPKKASVCSLHSAPVRAVQPPKPPAPRRPPSGARSLHSVSFRLVSSPRRASGRRRPLHSTPIPRSTPRLPPSRTSTTGAASGSRPPSLSLSLSRAPSLLHKWPRRGEKQRRRGSHPSQPHSLPSAAPGPFQKPRAGSPWPSTPPCAVAAAARRPAAQDPDLSPEESNAGAPRCRAWRRPARRRPPPPPLEPGPRRAARPRPHPSPSRPPPPSPLLLMAAAGQSPRAAFAGSCGRCPRPCSRRASPGPAPRPRRRRRPPVSRRAPPAFRGRCSSGP